MSQVTMKQLLEAGVHFGHQTSRWNPKMRRYIFGARNGIHIIDLQQTVTMFRDACDFVRQIGARGGSILFVGTKKQAQEPIRGEAERCGQGYVNTRWLGGALTNFQTIRQSIDRLKKVEETLEDTEQTAMLKKKEILMMEREKEKLLVNLRGVREMKRLPDAVFIIDPQREEIAVNEAKRLNIPVVAVVDTNCDPDDITHCIPGNDDAIRAIRLFCGAIADSYLEGQEEYKERSKAAADLSGEMGLAEAFAQAEGADDAAPAAEGAAPSAEEAKAEDAKSEESTETKKADDAAPAAPSTPAGDDTLTATPANPGSGE